jgi:hypothetical protein
LTGDSINEPKNAFMSSNDCDKGSNSNSHVYMLKFTVI